MCSFRALIQKTVFLATSRKIPVRSGVIFLLRSGCQIAGTLYKPNVGGMSLRRLLVAPYHAKQTYLAGIAVPAPVVIVIRRTPITVPLLNTESAQRFVDAALQLATILVENFVMMVLTVDSVHHLAR